MDAEEYAAIDVAAEDVDVVGAPDDVLEAHDLSHPRPNVLATVTEGDGPTIALNATSTLFRSRKRRGVTARWG